MGIKDYILIAVLYGSLALGLLLPAASSQMALYIKYFMMVMLFLAFIKISPRDVWHSLRRNPVHLSINGTIRLIAAPAAAYWVTYLLYPPLALPMLLLAGVSTGVSSPFFMSLCRGDISFALLMAVTTSLLVPFTLPAMVKLVAGAQLDYNLTAMALFLAQIILIPLVAAFGLRAVAPGMLRPITAGSYPISLLLIALINFGALGRYVSFLKANPDQVVISILFGMLTAAALAAIGWLAAANKGWPQKVASSGSQTWVNNVLLIALAVHLDNSLAAVLGAIYFVPAYALVVFYSVMSARQPVAESTH